MTKVLSKQTSHDGSLTVGQVVPKNYLPHTNWKTNDGKKSIDFSTLQKEQQMEKTLSLLERKEKNRRKLRTAKDREIIKKNLKEYREKSRPGSKNSMNDAEALYLRREAVTRSVSSLCRELKISRITADNCIKGITYKHLDCICKPQF